MQSDVETAVRRVDLFARLDDELLSAVAGASHVSAFAAGDLLIEQGAPPDEAWVIVEGSVELRRNGRQVAVYGPGRIVGDLSLLSGTPHSVDAVSLTDGARLVLGVGEFRAAVRNHPDVAFEFIKVLVERIYHMQDASDQRPETA